MNTSNPQQQPKKGQSCTLYLIISLILVSGIVVFCIKFINNRDAKTKDSMTAVASNPDEQKKVVDEIVKNMVHVTGGTFKMGTIEEKTVEQSGSAVPQHLVTLSDYYISRFEVTQQEWAAVMGTTPSNDVAPDHPVDNITWNDCQAFIQKLNKISGKNFRLPTEAEWEYAAKGGNKSRNYTYSGGNNINNVGWFEGNSTHEIRRQDTPDMTREINNVGLKKPNELGLYDMSGNAEEWCADFYAPYTSSAAVNPQGPSSGSYHVMRGGNYNDDMSYCEVTRRRFASGTFKSGSCGLRLAATTM